jgi:hypothetical protein
MSAKSPLAKELPLGDLVQGKQITIADPVPISHGYNEGYYIGRALRHHRAIKKEILIDKSENRFPDLIASTEQEFKQLCKLNPKCNVHWLEKDKSGKLLRQKSEGSLETLRRYIDTEISRTYAPDDVDKLLEQALQQRVVLISDTAGMGKSKIVIHLSKRFKQNFPAKWVVRIDLNDHTDALEALKKEQIHKEKATEFVSERLLKLNHLTSNGHFSGRTAPLTYRCCIFLFIQQIYVLNILNMLHTLRFFLFKMPFIS